MREASLDKLRKAQSRLLTVINLRTKLFCLPGILLNKAQSCLVRVEGVDDDVHQPRHLRLE